MLVKKQSVGTLFMLGLILAGCETTNTHETLNVTGPVSSLKANKTMQPHVAHAFLLMKEEKFTEASSFINQALQSHPKSVILHILNALTYEKLAEQGDVSGIELAVVGYQNAMSLDPFNSFAITQLGKIRYREQQFDQAQEHFANALLLKPNDPDLIHEFAAASYYAYDIKSALAAIKKAEKLKPDDPLIQRSTAMMYAAVGDFKTAEKHFKLFQAKVGQDPEVAHVANRFNDWQSLYKSGRLTLAAAETTPKDKETKIKDTDTKTTTTTVTETTTKKPPKQKPAPKKPSSQDTGTAGAGSTDTSNTDTNNTDMGSADTGNADTGNADTSNTDQGAAGGTGSTDTGSTDTGSTDTGSTDQGTTGGTDQGGTAAGGGTSKDGAATGGTAAGGSAAGGTAATGGTAAGAADQGGAAGGADQGGEDAGTSIDSAPPAEGDQATKDEVKRGDLAQSVLNSPVTPGIASAGGAAPGGPGGPGAPGSPAPGPEVAEEANQQIIMDCYILQITEAANTSKGNNILDALAVTLNPGSYMNFKGSMWGSGALPTTNSSVSGDKVSYTADSAYSSGFTDPGTGKFIGTSYNVGSTNPSLNNMGSISGRIFTAGLTWAGLTYSLNIANAADLRTEIVSRPTLMTFINKESRFFSGTELVNVSGGNYGSNLSRYQIGVTLAITPESLVGEKVSLNIGVESSLLQNTNPNLQATVDVSKTKVETTARVRLGETIMLGGIYERTEVDIQQGFPGLRDIPFVQYFFSNQKTISDRRSIVILLTPRSPDAVKSAVNRAMTRESVRPHFSELVSRNPDWFHPDTNAINIFSYINLDPILYYEFRTGDILPPSWGYDPAVKDKLAELSAFLYY